MECTQENIERAVSAYNEVTRAHKRAPVERYIRKQLEAGESVDLLSGDVRWTSSLRFSGTPEDMRPEFVINPALPERFREHLERTQEQFFSLLRQ